MRPTSDRRVRISECPKQSPLGPRVELEEKPSGPPLTYDRFSVVFPALIASHRNRRSELMDVRVPALVDYQIEEENGQRKLQIPSSVRSPPPNLFFVFCF